MSTIEYVAGATHYADRKVHDALHVRTCRKGMIATCGGAFKCAKCKRLVGWCRGASDGTVADDWCDKCQTSGLTKGVTK